MKNISNLTDKELLALCQKYGTQAILWKRKFIGLLPEVDRRRLYEKKKCVSIYEFAAKFGGVTKKHTQRVIQIDKAFEEKGVAILREMLQEGTASISKLVKVVSVVTVENESDIVTAVRNLSHESLETYVRDMRYALGYKYGGNTGGVTGREIGMFEDGFSKPSDCPKSVRPNTFEKGEETENGGEKADTARIPMGDAKMVGTNTVEMQSQAVALKKLRLNLSEEVLDEMLKLQEKGIDVNEVLKEILEKREEEIATKKETHGEKVLKRELKRKDAGKTPSRNMSTVTKRILKEEFGTKCSVVGCKKEATQIHHTVPFSINGSNSPDLLKPLCRAHHDIVHSINTAYVGKKGMDLRTESWR